MILKVLPLGFVILLSNDIVKLLLLKNSDILKIEFKKYFGRVIVDKICSFELSLCCNLANSCAVKTSAIDSRTLLFLDPLLIESFLTLSSALILLLILLLKNLNPKEIT